MNNKIVIYLFVFTALVLIFQLVNSKKILDDQKDRLINLKENNLNYEKTVLKLQTELDEVINFSLKNNEYALAYFNEIKIENPTSLIEGQLYQKNLIKEKKIIPNIEKGRTFLINKIKVLNHKWLIASFSDGTVFGEIFLSFKMDELGKVSYELKEHLIYPSSDLSPLSKLE